MENPRRFKLIACEILYREICYCTARARHRIDLTFLPKALHDVGSRSMSVQLQAAIDTVDTTVYDAILLAYGLCNNGVCGLHSALPLVIPRAHDCITLLLGSRLRYQEVFNRCPGTYYKSTGWMERADEPFSQPNSVTAQLGIGCDYETYVSKYGEDNARYLWETLGSWHKRYHKLAYIDTGFGNFEAYHEIARTEAEERGWEYELLQGNTKLLQQLVDGEWDPSDFLVVPPQTPIQPSCDDSIICCGT